MKRRLNILCLLVVLVLGYSIFESLYQAGISLSGSMKAGWEAGANKDKSEIEKIAHMKVVAVFPDDFPLFHDSILNEKTGEYVPMMHNQMIVSVQTEPNMGQQMFISLLGIVNVFVVIIAIVFFVRLIISINRSDIFRWKNVRRLRWLGIALIISFLCSVVPAVMTNHILSGAFSLKGYSLHFSDFISITNLVLGLTALIVGEVFAIGLKMKEEQDLTI